MTSDSYLALKSIYGVNTPIPDNHLAIAVVQGDMRVEDKEREYLVLSMTLDRESRKIKSEQPITHTKSRIRKI